eukprot:Rmarinus@m.13857
MRWKGETGKCCETRRFADFEIIHDTLPPASARDVTLITQGTFSRFSAFAHTADAWPGPKIVGMFFSAYSEEEEKKVAEEIAILTEMAESYENTLVFAYIARGPDSCTDAINTYTPPAKSTQTAHPLLPVNSMRNAATDAARTRFVFPLDLDFYPSHTLYDKFRKIFMPIVAEFDRAVFVVPQFAAFHCGPDAKTKKEAELVFKPNVKDFEDLKSAILDGRVKTFHGDNSQMKLPKDMNSKCKVTQHDPTPLYQSKYDKWWKESTKGLDGAYYVDVTMKYKHSLKLSEIVYEPFVILSRTDKEGKEFPRYNEKFVGYLKNKISFLTSLRILKYHFFVMRREFVLHAPHPKTTSIQETPGHWDRTLGIFVKHIQHDFAKAENIKRKMANPYQNGFEFNQKEVVALMRENVLPWMDEVEPLALPADGSDKSGGVAEVLAAVQHAHDFPNVNARNDADENEIAKEAVQQDGGDIEGGGEDEGDDEHGGGIADAAGQEDGEFLGFDPNDAEEVRKVYERTTIQPNKAEDGGPNVTEPFKGGQ